MTPFWQSKPPIYLGRARRESLHAQAPHRAGDGLASGHRVNLLERYDYPIAWRHFDAALVVAVNHWSPLAGFPELGLLQNLVRDWLAAERPRATPQASSDGAWARKLSYLRGLLVAEAHHGLLGLEQPLSREAVMAMAADACAHQWRVQGSSRTPLGDWDAEGFVDGYLDLAALSPATPEAIRAFARSDRMRISLEEARIGYAALGAVRGGALVSLAGLLEPAGR